MSAPDAATLIDVVDLGDHPVGTTPRGRVLDAGKNFRTVHVFVFDAAGHLLLQRLAPTRKRHPDRWGSSVAAYLFAGEDYRDAAKRRLQEELDISAPLDFVGKTEMRDQLSLKFVSLFKAECDWPRIGDPTHISGLEFRSVTWIRDRITANPAGFTPTFVTLFDRFEPSLGQYADIRSS